MKKNSVDQVFSKKLGQLESTPSAAAWQQLNSQLNHRQRKGRAYYWAAAAALLLATTTGYIVLNQEGPATKPATQLAVQPAVQSQPTPAAEEVLPLPLTVKELTGPTQLATTQPGNTAAVTNSTTAAGPAAGLPQATTQPAQAAAQAAYVSQPAAEVELPPLEALPSATLAQNTDEAEALPLSATLPAQPSEKIIIEYRAAVSSPVSSTAIAATPAAEAQDDQPAVLRVLEDVKRGNIGLADLRSAKNQLFARITNP